MAAARLASSSRAAPAEPLLASALVSLDEVQERPRKRLRVATGCGAVDDALEGGLVLGQGGVVCVSGDGGVGKSALSLAFLASLLLGHPSSHASVIDTTGTFDVVRLYHVILVRLRAEARSHSSDAAATAAERPSEGDMEDEAARVLDRVKIMRVFDFTGLAEAIGEIMEGLGAAGLVSQADVPAEQADGRAAPAEGPVDAEPGGERHEIADSEAEDEDDEMLFDSMNPSAPARAGNSGPDAQLGNGSEGGQQPLGVRSQHRRPGMIVVDNLTQVFSPLLKANWTQAHALLLSFLRTLTQQTYTHNLLTILINNSIPRRRSFASSRAQPPDPADQLARTVTAPVFASTASRPALSPIFSFLVDVHLFLTAQPLRKRDAAALAQHWGGVQGEASGTLGGQCTLATVLEVCSDRHEARVGRWAAFHLRSDGGLEAEKFT